MGYEAKIVLDSVSRNGYRLTSMVCTYPRFVHAEMLTHRVFSRNTSSSRAIPIAKVIEQVQNDPVIPISWGKNQAGMQAHQELDERLAGMAKERWLLSRDHAVDSAKSLMMLGVHKQLVNRLLEPWVWVTCLISSTEWDNFFKLRCHKDAQPEIRHIAELMRDSLRDSVPVPRDLHRPFVSEGEFIDIWDDELDDISAARCARVSYNKHGENTTSGQDIGLAEKLAAAGHWSPFEHVARARPGQHANFNGWLQYRALLEG